MLLISCMSATQNNVTSFLGVEQLANILSYRLFQQWQKMVKRELPRFSVYHRQYRYIKITDFMFMMEKENTQIHTFSRQRLACLAAMAFLNSWESGYNIEWCGCTEGKRFLSSCSATMLTSFFMRAS